MRFGDEHKKVLNIKICFDTGHLIFKTYRTILIFFYIIAFENKYKFVGRKIGIGRAKTTCITETNEMGPKNYYPSRPHELINDS